MRTPRRSVKPRRGRPGWVARSVRRVLPEDPLHRRREFLEAGPTELVRRHEHAVVPDDDAGQVAVVERPYREPVLAEFARALVPLRAEPEPLRLREPDQVCLRVEIRPEVRLFDRTLGEVGQAPQLVDDDGPTRPCQFLSLVLLKSRGDHDSARRWDGRDCASRSYSVGPSRSRERPAPRRQETWVFEAPTRRCLRMMAVRVTEYSDSTDAMEVVDIEKPEPGQGEVRIEVKAAGINFADIMQRRGHYTGGPEPPYTAGLEVAGVVDAVGEGVGRSEGQEVVAMVGEAGYAEYAIGDAMSLLDIPEGMSFEEAAGFPVQFLTAHNCLHEWGGLEEGEDVLVHAAAGGVGTAAVQIASEAGARVLGTASTQEKLDKAVELGCEVPVNYTEEDFVEVCKTETDYGVDLVLDGIGGDTTEESLDALKEFGRMVSFGAAAGRPGRPPTDKLLFGNKSVIGYHLGKAAQRKPMKVMSAAQELNEMLSDGTLEVQIGHTFDLEDAAEAHQFIEDRKSKGKVVLVP